MKPKHHLRPLLLAASSSLLGFSSASAQSGTWITDADAAWNVSSNWSGGTIASGADNTASFTLELTGSRAITLGADRTIGHIVFTDTTPSHNLSLSGNTLTLDVTSGAPTIDVTQTGRTLTIGSTISGNDGLTKKGIGLLSLTTSTNTFTGTVKVEAGRLTVDNNARLGNTANAIVVDSGGTLFYNSNSAINRAATISGLGWTEQDTQSTQFGALRLGNGSTYSGTITLAGDARIGGFADGDRAATVSGKITGAHGVEFFSAAQSGSPRSFTFTLSNTGNDYTGNTTITNGGYNSTSITNRTTLRLGASNVIPNGTNAGNVVFDYDGTNTASTVVLDMNGRSDTINGISVNPGSFTSRITNSSTTAASVLTIGDNNADGSFSGIIEDSDATNNLGITKIGSGTLTLSGANTYRGNTIVSGGTLKLGASNVLPDTSAITVGGASTNGTLDLNGFSDTTTALLGLGTNASSVAGLTHSIVNTGGAAVLTVGTSSGTSVIYRPGATGFHNGQATISANLGLSSIATTALFDVGDSTNTALELLVSGTISGTTANLSKGGAGTMRLTGTNTYKNRTFINNGTLEVDTLANIGTASSLGTGDQVSGTSDIIRIGTGANANVTLNYIGSGSSTDRRIQIGEGATNTSGATLLNTGTGALSFTGASFNAADTGATVARTLTLGGSNTGANTIQGAIVNNSGSGIVNLTKQDAGRWILAGTNTYTGTTNVNGGTLQLGNGGTTGSLSSSSAISIGSGATFAINRSNTVTQGTDFSSAAITGDGSFTQAGTGTTILTAANTYTGTTNVNAGTLRINGSTASASAVTVASGATLGGNGTINGTLTVDGSVAPGQTGGSIQTLNAGATTWNAGNSWKFDLSNTSSASDLLAITGAFTKGTGGAGAFVFDFMGSTPVWNTTYTLATFSSLAGGFMAGDTSPFSYTGLGAGPYGASFFTLTGSSLTFTAVPEPTTALGGLLLTAGLLRRRRKG